MGSAAQAACCLFAILSFGVLPGASSDGAGAGAGSKAAGASLSTGSSPVGRGRSRSPGPTVKLTVVDGEAYEEYVEQRY